MQAFCANCDKSVEVASAEAKCPICHRSVLSAPPASSPAPKSKKGLVIGVTLAAAAVGGGFMLWQFHLQGAGAGAPAVAATPGTEPTSLAARLAKSGLTGDAAIAPGAPDPAMQAAVKDAGNKGGIGAYVQSLVADKWLREQDHRARRADVPKPTAKLFADIIAHTAKPVHPVEAAFLVAALAEAQGKPGTLVTDSAGVQSPLLLSRTRLGVRLGDGSIVEAFAKAPMQKPVPVSAELATVWWLVLRSHAERMALDFAAANADLAAADAVLPNQPVVAFARGVLALDQGMTDQGLPMCEAALQTADDPMAKLALVQMAVQLDQPVKAWSLAESAAKTHPELAEAHVAMGVLAMQRVSAAPDAQKQALTAQAKAELDKAFQIDAQVPGVRAALAQWHFQQKDAVAGEKVLRDGLAAKDGDAALMLAEWLRSQNKFTEALQALTDSGLDQTDERAAVAVAQNLIGGQKIPEAALVVDAALKANPSSRQLLMLRAELLRQQGKLAEAAEALQPLTASGPDADRAKLLQAQLHLQGGEFAKALAILEPAMAAKPTDRETTMLLMIAHALGGAPEKGEAVAQKAIADKVMTATDVAGVWLQARQPERAIKLLEALAEAPAPETEQVALLAMLYTASGQKEMATKLRDRIVQKAGDKGKDVGTAIDQAITSAEEELAKMKKAEAAAPQGATP